MRGIPIFKRFHIAVTARTTSGERELAIAAGCEGYITKTIDVMTFLIKSFPILMAKNTITVMSVIFTWPL